MILTATVIIFVIIALLQTSKLKKFEVDNKMRFQKLNHEFVFEIREREMATNEPFAIFIKTTLFGRIVWRKHIVAKKNKTGWQVRFSYWASKETEIFIMFNKNDNLAVNKTEN